VLSLITSPRMIRPALTLDQASAVLDAAVKMASSTMYAYIVLSLLIGARTERIASVRWDHVATPRRRCGQVAAGRRCRMENEQFAIQSGGQCVPAETPRHASLGGPWQCRSAALTPSARCGITDDARNSCACIVFISQGGTELDAHNVR
jgi:hypothetical protein